MRDLQAIARSLRGVAVQTLQFPDLFAGKLPVGNSAE